MDATEATSHMRGGDPLDAVNARLWHGPPAV